MSAWTIEFTTKAERQFAKLAPSVRERLAPHINQLAVEPRPSGCKKLQGTDNLWRIRVGEHRIIYQIQGGRLVILIVTLGDRKDVYR